MTEANDTYRYDAFISYSHHDKDWVDGWLLPHLEAAGLRVCIDFRDFEPGLPSLVNMENAVERSRKTLIVLTPAWVESQWTTFESLLIQTDDPAGRQRRMIPLRLKPCEPPKRIAMLTYVDFTQPAEAESQLQRLVKAITAEPPDVPPPIRERVPGPLPPEPTRPPEVADFVGRESELAYYADKLATSHLAVITGMAGVGKTALGAELARQVAGPNKIFWHSFHEGEGIEVIIWELAAFLAWHGQEDLWRMLQSIQQTGGQILPPEVLFNYLIQMVRGQGYLLCFDDLQFVDDNTLFAQLVERLRSSVLAGELSFVATSRRMPEFVQMVKFEPLAGLSATYTCRLVAKRGLSLSDDLAADLHARTDGNAQLLTLAIDALQHAEDPADLIARLLETEDIERYLMTEVDEGLTEDERAVMGAVAVLLGYPGTRDAIEAVLDKGGVRRALIDLSSRYLLIVSESEAGREYGQHAIVQAFYYDLLGRRERRAMHRRAGEYYETEELDILKAARHLGRAGEYERAARLLTEHSGQLINAGRARPMLEQLLKFERGQLDLESWLSVCEAESDAFALLGEYDRATESLGSILSMVDSQGLPAADRRRMAEINRKIGKICEQRGEHGRALEYYEAGISDLGDEYAQTVEMARIYKDIGHIYNRRGEYDAAIGICLQALRAVEGTDHIQEVGDIYNALGDSHKCKGGYSEAINYYEKGLAMFERAKDRHSVARLYNNLGIVYRSVCTKLKMPGQSRLFRVHLRMLSAILFPERSFAHGRFYDVLRDCGRRGTCQSCSLDPAGNVRPGDWIL